METAQKPAVARLQTLLVSNDNMIVCPGVYDGLTARIALRVGFECLYLHGGTQFHYVQISEYGN